MQNPDRDGESGEDPFPYRRHQPVYSSLTRRNRKRKSSLIDESLVFPDDEAATPHVFLPTRRPSHSFAAGGDPSFFRARQSSGFGEDSHQGTARASLMDTNPTISRNFFETESNPSLSPSISFSLDVPQPVAAAPAKPPLASATASTDAHQDPVFLRQQQLLRSQLKKPPPSASISESILKKPPPSWQPSTSAAVSHSQQLSPLPPIPAPPGEFATPAAHRHSTSSYFSGNTMTAGPYPNSSSSTSIPFWGQSNYPHYRSSTMNRFNDQQYYQRTSTATAVTSSMDSQQRIYNTPPPMPNYEASPLNMLCSAAGVSRRSAQGSYYGGGGNLAMQIDPHQARLAKKRQTAKLLKHGGVVQVAPGKFIRFRGTKTAKQSDSTVVVRCQHCLKLFHVDSKAQNLYCRPCKQFTPLTPELMSLLAPTKKADQKRAAV